MCLDLNKDAKKQTAAEDIVCYKRVIYIPDFTSYKGKSFTGIINGIACEGKIQIENNRAYFCTNEPKLYGDPCSNTLGYSCSWVIDWQVKSIIIDGVEIMKLTDALILLTPYQYAKVQVGETYTSKLIHQRYSINIGLHSFTTYKNARNDSKHGMIVKCVIPKGAEYYLGKFNGNPSYASNKIKYLEIIEE